MRISVLLFAVSSLGACGGGFGWNPLQPDADSDGVPDRDEEALGLDPGNADSDGDGLSDGDELALGSDPLIPDTDADYLLDGDEIDVGTDVSNPDTDGDSYLDGSEVVEGTDPLDPTDVIYQGGWPYVHDKDAIGGGMVLEVGKRFRDFQMVDQFGDTVSIHDFHNSDKYVVVAVRSLWHPWDQDLSQYFLGDNDSQPHRWDAIRDAVKAGNVFWIDVIAAGLGGVSSQEELQAEIKMRFDQYPHDKIPILNAWDGAIVDYINTYSFYYPPTITLLTPELKVDTLSEADGTSSASYPLDALLDYL